MIDLTHAINSLRAAVTIEEQALETMAEVALITGDQALAEELAEQALNLGRVLPNLATLSMLPAEPAPVTMSAAPTPEELGMRMAYRQSIRMLAEAQVAHALEENTETFDAVQCAEMLVYKVRALYRLAIEN